MLVTARDIASQAPDISAILEQLFDVFAPTLSSSKGGKAL